MRKLIVFVLTISMLLSMLLINVSAVNMVTSDVVYLWPVPQSTYMTSKCGEYGHLGIDITTVYDDTVVVAARSGEVTIARPSDCEHINGYGTDTCNGGCGNYVVIRHDDGSVGKYFHFKYATICVTAGQRVEAGDKLGIMGSSGMSTGTHLHFQINSPENVLVNNNVDTMDYAFTKEYLTADAEYELWQVGAAYNIRSTPSLDGEKVGAISTKSFVAITEWQEVEGKMWGKILFTAPFTKEYRDCFIGLEEETKVKDVRLSGGSGLPPIHTDTDTEIDSDSNSDIDTDLVTDTDTNTETDTEVKTEKWIIDANTKLRIRDGATLSANTVGYLYGGETVEVTEVISADGYTWGHIDNVNGDITYQGKWCSLDYATKIDDGVGGETDTDINTDTEVDTETDTETDTDIETVLGDVNGDKSVDVIDVALIRAHIVGSMQLSIEQVLSGDLNSDSILDIIDVALIRKTIVEG